jgi:hypothetical protein
MIAGHFGFAAGVKSRERQVPLWALMLATQWMDVIFVPLFLLGIERIVPLPGTKGGYGEGIIYADYTHSLLGAALIAASFGLVAALPWGRRAGMVLGAVVFSHWVLDLIVHRADLPILPGNVGGLPRLGFGLWRIPAAAAGLELALVVAGAYLYWRAAVETARAAGGARLRRANLVAVLILAFGILTLVLSILGY